MMLSHTPDKPRLRDIQPLPEGFDSSSGARPAHEVLSGKTKTAQVKPRKKQWAPKVRTGCRPCKESRHKCDERRPCTRCAHKGISCVFEPPTTWLFRACSTRDRGESTETSTSSGIQTCGLSSSDKPLSVVEPQTLGTRTVEDLIWSPDTRRRKEIPKSGLLTAIPALPYSLDEQKSVRFYLEFTSKIASRFDSSTFFWATIFIDRASRSEAVRNSLIFFARDFEKISQGRVTDEGQELLHFNLASRALGIEYHAVENVLLSGTMFWMADMFHCRWTRAMLHIEYLLKIIKEARHRALTTGVSIDKNTETIISYVEPLASHCLRFLGLQRSRTSLKIQYDQADPRLVRYIQNCGDCEIRLLDIERRLLAAVDVCRDRARKMNDPCVKLRQRLELVANTMESLVSQFPAPYSHSQEDHCISTADAMEIFHVLFTSKHTLGQFCDVVETLTSDVGKIRVEDEDQILTRLRCTKVEHLLPYYTKAIASPIQDERDQACEVLTALKLT